MTIAQVMTQQEDFNQDWSPMMPSAMPHRHKTWPLPQTMFQLTSKSRVEGRMEAKSSQD